MTIIHNNVHNTVNAQTVIYASDSTVSIIANAAMMSMAEANIDMILDLGKEYNTKADIESVFIRLHEQAQDFVDEAMAELREKLMRRLRNMQYTAQVRRMDYDDKGELEDIHIHLDIK